ncbi:glutathione S-transferase family protein [Curvivirga aplysinae]|uniref:glutathione S-transferase family protein n=1 Tax=Curvivirga aplysinae TaxID=2529852 RepID=UPI0012BC36F3|nr:glutathione S-transferase family protein [Curvivirga aplysinae]MTI10236.1 glutathione S-transferase family protein [Curvivirga aplysinae]
MKQLLLVIGNKNYSSWSLRPWLVMKFANIDFACETVPLFTEEGMMRIRAESPNKKVPYLKTDDMVLSESLAIAEYIAELYPNKGLWPEDPVKRAKARSICMGMASGFFNIRNEMPMNVRRRNKPIELSEAAWREVKQMEKLWRETREDYAQAGPFLFGERSIADAFFAPVIWRFNSYISKKDLLPETIQYMKVMLAMPEMQGWAAMASEESWRIDKVEI